MVDSMFTIYNQSIINYIIDTIIIFITNTIIIIINKDKI